MAVEEGLQPISLPVASDQSANQYRFMEVDANGRIAACNAIGEPSVGVLQDKPDALGRPGLIAISGRTKIVFGGTVAAGARIATDATGRAVTVATGNNDLGVCIEGGTIGLIGSMVFNPGRTAP